MKRVYLEEDLELVKKYFPGARAIALRTPFDLTQRCPRLPRLAPDSFTNTDDFNGWTEETVWMN